jgi:hypothetical protein
MKEERTDIISIIIFIITTLWLLGPLINAIFIRNVTFTLLAGYLVGLLVGFIVELVVFKTLEEDRFPFVSLFISGLIAWSVSCLVYVENESFAVIERKNEIQFLGKGEGKWIMPFSGKIFRSPEKLNKEIRVGNIEWELEGEIEWLDDNKIFSELVKNGYEGLIEKIVREIQESVKNNLDSLPAKIEIAEVEVKDVAKVKEIKISRPKINKY